MPLQFDKLFLSPRHKFTRNPDPATANWPEIYFWTTGLRLMNLVHALLYRFPELDAKARAGFWKGSMPAQFLNDYFDLATFRPEQVVEYGRVEQSMDLAQTRLIIRARGERENPKGAEREMSHGDVWLDIKQAVISEAAKFKTVVSRMGQAEYIYKAAKRNDVRFFIRLGKALQSKRRLPDVDWNRPGCDPVAIFLAWNWCEPQAYNSRFPALCFFADQALADFCSGAFGLKPGTPSLDAIRQWRRRLGLEQISSPKIKKTTISGNKILVEGK